MSNLNLRTSMKAFDFDITVSIKGKNLESVKNKLSGWLEPSLALKKNDSITLKSVDLSDNASSTKKPATKKRRPCLRKRRKQKSQRKKTNGTQSGTTPIGTP